MHFEAKANLGSPLQPASMFATTNTSLKAKPHLDQHGQVKNKQRLQPFKAFGHHTLSWHRSSSSNEPI